MAKAPSPASATRPKLVLIDAHALIHRAFHAIPFLSTKDGELTNAVFGFTSSVLTVLKELQPEYVAVSFDLPEPTFRHQKYADYKATRQKAPDELRSQFGRVREVVETLGMPIFEVAGYEADDVIGSLAKQTAARDGVDPYIVTGDRDSLQLVDEHVKIHMLKWRPGGRETITYDLERLKEDTGLSPDEFIEYKALLGDTSDNIPGVPGIGEKTATALVQRYQTLEGVYAALTEEAAEHPLIKPKVRENLATYREQAFLSRDLSRIVTDIPLEFKLGACTLTDFDLPKASELFRQLEFSSLLPRLQSLAGEVAASGPGAATGTALADAQKAGAAGAAPPAPRDWSKKSYELVGTEKAFAAFLKALKEQAIFAFDTETERLDSIAQNLVGLSFSWGSHTGYYLPLKHASGPVLPFQPTLEALTPILTDPAVGKVGHHLKYDYAVLRAYGIETQGLAFDTMLGSYLLNPGARTLGLSKLAYQELGYEMQPITELIGEGTGRSPKQQKSMAEVSSEDVAPYAAEDADITWQLYEKLSADVATVGVQSVLEDIELPTLAVLVKMEQRGVQLDTAFLEKMSERFARELTKIERNVHKHAGREFNLNSPSQLATVLFDELKLGDGKGSRRGGGQSKRHVTTAAARLEQLKDAHPIVAELLRYRELSKLKSTYLDALPHQVRADTGRLHTSYSQTVAATGRLSSSDPNLQNIPIRTPQGRKIRQGFVTQPGWKLVSADYSQFELRLAAHISGDVNLAEKFRQGLDIHAATAAEVAGIPLGEVTPEQRYAAKAVNFSILYGATPHGVSKSTGMSVTDAGEYIDRYFKTYPQIREYMDAMIAKAETDGYVETLFGRRRYLPEIKASVYPVRESAKRMAINMPIQGTQADILKLAMVAIDRELPAAVPEAYMLLTVHDELVFEVPEGQALALAGFVTDRMEHAYELDVPIVAEAKVGDNWGEMEGVD